jgi:predicted dehydrogenase
MMFSFEQGRVHMRDIDGTLEILDGRTNYHETRSLVRDGSRWNSYNASFDRSLEAYLESLRSGGQPPIPGIDGLRELQTEAAIKRSIAERRPVRVAEEFPLL